MSKKKNKPIDEKETRARLMAVARQDGFEADLIKIFQRIDDALKGCKTQEEKQAISVMGVFEIDKLFNGRVMLKDETKKN